MIISKQLSPYYVIGILNSELSNFWYSKFGYDYHGEKTKKYEPEKAEKYLIPIKLSSKEDYENLILRVNDIIKLYNELYRTHKETDKYNEIIKEIERQTVNIDVLVYKIYNIDNDNKNLIKKYLEA